MDVVIEEASGWKGQAIVHRRVFAQGKGLVCVLYETKDVSQGSDFEDTRKRQEDKVAFCCKTIVALKKRPSDLDGCIASTVQAGVRSAAATRCLHVMEHGFGDTSSLVSLASSLSEPAPKDHVFQRPSLLHAQDHPNGAHHFLHHLTLFTFSQSSCSSPLSPPPFFHSFRSSPNPPLPHSSPPPLSSFLKKGNLSENLPTGSYFIILNGRCARGRRNVR